MKKVSILFLLIVMTACAPAQPSTIPVGTIVAQTLNALAPVAPSSTPLPQVVPSDTSTQTPLPSETPIPENIYASALQCIPASAVLSAGQVVRVVDGDTIEVNIDGQGYKVRYIGIDTPENTTKKEPFGPEASAANEALVAGQTVILAKDVSETDRYDRLLRYVMVGNVFVNYELVHQGFAYAVTYPPDVACEETFRTAEGEARELGIGLWAPLVLQATIEPTKEPEATETPAPEQKSTATLGPTKSPVVKPTATQTVSGNCSPAYPGVCIPPAPPDLDCGDISYRRFTVLSPDPHRFDGDGDGFGCES